MQSNIGAAWLCCWNLYHMSCKIYSSSWFNLLCLGYLFDSCDPFFHFPRSCFTRFRVTEPCFNEISAMDVGKIYIIIWCQKTSNPLKFWLRHDRRPYGNIPYLILTTLSQQCWSEIKYIFMNFISQILTNMWLTLFIRHVSFSQSDKIIRQFCDYIQISIFSYWDWLYLRLDWMCGYWWRLCFRWFCIHCNGICTYYNIY